MKLAALLTLLCGCASPQAPLRSEFTLIRPRIDDGNGVSEIAIYSRAGVSTNEWVYRASTNFDGSVEWFKMRP